jgi:hypothetical protein
VQKIILFILFCHEISVMAATPMSAESLSSNPAAKCISAICGPASTTQTYFSTFGDKAAEYFDQAKDPKAQIFPKDYEALINAMNGEDQKQNALLLAELKRSSSLGNAGFSGLSKGLYNAMFAGKYDDRIKMKTAVINGVEITAVDEKASRAALKSLPSADREWLIAQKKYFLQLDDDPVSEDLIESQPPAQVLKTLHPDLPIKDSMKIELFKAQSEMASLKNLNPTEFSILCSDTNPARVALIAKHMADGSLTENEAREIIKWNYDYKQNKALFLDPQSPYLTRQTPPVEAVIQKKGGISGLSRAFIKNRQQDKEDTAQDLEICRTQYFINKRLLPTEAQNRAALDDGVRAKQLVESMIKEKFPANMQQVLIGVVEKADFVTPPTSEAYERDFKESFKTQLETERQQTAQLSVLPPNEIRETLAAFSALSGKAKSLNDSATSNDLCQPFIYPPVSDRVYTPFGSIILSYSSVTGDQAGRLMVMMHELGHVVSKAISENARINTEFEPVRKCLETEHSELNKDVKLKNGTHLSTTAGKYLEEDLADTISGESKPSVRKNGFCDLTNIISHEEYDDRGIVQRDEDDVHSSTLFRLFDFEVLKSGHLPDPCDAYSSQEQFKPRFRSCLDFLKSPATVSRQGTVK